MNAQMRGQHSHSYGSPYFLLGTETFEQEKGKKMSRFTPEEIAYLQSQRLGRLQRSMRKAIFTWSRSAFATILRPIPSILEDTISPPARNIVRRCVMGVWPLSSMMCYRPGNRASWRCEELSRRFQKGGSRSCQPSRLSSSVSLPRILCLCC